MSAAARCGRVLRAGARVSRAWRAPALAVLITAGHAPGHAQGHTVDPALGLPPLQTPPAAQVLLGRALFFERRLAVNGTLSCAMCHVPEQGFTSNELRTSVGMEGVSLRRNAPTLLNVAYVRELFHDGRARDLEQQAAMPLLHPDEMANTSMAAVVARLARWPAYRPLFGRAFGDTRPSARRIVQALAAYQRSLVAGGSRFDRWRFGGEADALDVKEQRGFALFVSAGCVACHPVGERDALFTDHGFHNVGVQARSDALRRRDVSVELIPGMSTTLTRDDIARVGVADAPDLGRQEVTGAAADARAFRTPSLRNVALTGPYMHDGSLASLEAVLEHYGAGGWPGDPAQDPRILALAPALDADGRDAIVAFLKTLDAARLPDRTPPQPAAVTGAR